MYDWLSDLPHDCSVHVVTPNRRIARVLREAYAARQLAAGSIAWRTPPVYALTDWYRVLADDLPTTGDVALRINEQQARILWEECLRQAIDDPFVNVGALARLCRDAWQRLQDWQVPLREAHDSATSQDQNLFARTAGRFASLLRDRGYADGATLPSVLRTAVDARTLAVPAGVLCCGFDRVTPQFAVLLASLEQAGTDVRTLPVGTGGAAPRLLSYADPDAELRAAGAWARAALEQDPDQAIAIVVTRLEQDAGRVAALVREGLVPGWQGGPGRLAAAVDLSIGPRLADLPAIHIALLALRWFQQPLGGVEIGTLLRSGFVGTRETAGRSRLELVLREWPDREWRMDVLLAALAGRDDSPDATDWLERFQRAREAVMAGPGSRGPARWAEQFERVLDTLNWPGEAQFDSDDFQLDNRWRKLLNEFARLELVIPAMQGRDAVSRLAALAADTVFQPETTGAVVTVLGPLEAAGLEFDRLRLTGAVATDWPPTSRALALLSRGLQQKYGMPDATPEDTAEFARRVLRRITVSAPDVTLTFPRMVGDAAQVPTRLLDGLEVEPGHGDPGWNAARIAGTCEVREVADRTPALRPGERVGGGAATIQRQSEEPFTAFASGRLRARPLRSFTRGIAANVRGNLVHAALARLYAGRPDQAALRHWSAAERAARIGTALDHAFLHIERHADDVLRQLCALERARTASLLAAVVETDLARASFAVLNVEARIDAVLGQVPLYLRCDRIDRLADGSVAILDYKTGQAKKFAGKDGPHDLQLVVYACAVAETVAGLGLFNVDSRHVGLDGAGPVFGKADDWHRELAEWRAIVYRLADKLAEGDVRLNIRQGLAKARLLSVLSRYPEVYRGD